MEQQELQLNHYLGLLWRGRWLILLTTLVAFGGVLVFARPQPGAGSSRSYEATATIKIEAKEATTTADTASSLASLVALDTDINTQIRIIQSRSVMEKALEKLQPSQENQAPNTAAPAPTPSSSATIQVEDLSGAITVQPILKTNLLEIKARGDTPELAEKRANSVVEAYIDYTKAERTRAIEEALEKVTARLQNSSQLLEQDPREVLLVPNLQAELAGLVRLVERSSQDFGRLQQQLTPIDAESLLRLEAPRIEAVAGNLEVISRNLQMVLERLKGSPDPQTTTPGQVSNSSLADGLAVVQRRVKTDAENLAGTLENIQTQDTVPDSSERSDNQVQRINEIAGTVLSLDVASRQLQGLLRVSADPLVQGELAVLGDQLAKAHDSAKAISEHLVLPAADGDTGPIGSFALAQNQLNVVVSILRTASEEYRELSGDSSNDISQDTIARFQGQIDTGAAILGRVSEDLKKLQSSETDPLRYGELVVIDERISGASKQASNISTLIQQGQNQQGPSGQEELIQLRQQLELSRLSPQETGITLVDSAVVSRSLSGNSRSVISGLRLPLSGLAGMLLGFLAVFLKEQIDQTVRSQQRLRAQLGLVTLGVVPKGKAPGYPHPPMVSAHDPSAFSEALQLVGIALEGSLRNGATSFVITSATPKEGKTMLAVNLAQVLAQYGRRVLLVDGNLRKPDVAEVLNLSEEDGLSTALEQRQNPADYILDAGAFEVLPAGKPASNPIGLLSDRLLRAFLQQAQQQYDVVLLDSPPAVGFAETKILAKEVSGAILVVRSGANSVGTVKAGKEELEAAGVPVVGAVLNFASAEECSYLRHESYGPARKKDRWFWKIPKLRISSPAIRRILNADGSYFKKP